MAEPLNLALPKGRVHQEAVQLFAKAGYDLSATLGKSRQLVFDCGPLRVFVLRHQDVPTYVERGAADVGVAGIDVLLEQDGDLAQPLDLGIGRCRMVVAEPKKHPVDENRQFHMRIATKYPAITKRHLEERGAFAELIKLYGSMELAPSTGLADRIVDLVSSGETLKQNGLREIETILEVSARLIVNRASLKLRFAEIDQVIKHLAAVL